MPLGLHFAAKKLLLSLQQLPAHRQRLQAHKQAAHRGARQRSPPNSCGRGDRPGRLLFSRTIRVSHLHHRCSLQQPPGSCHTSNHPILALGLLHLLIGSGSNSGANTPHRTPVDHLQRLTLVPRSL